MQINNNLSLFSYNHLKNCGDPIRNSTIRYCWLSGEGEFGWRNLHPLPWDIEFLIDESGDEYEEETEV